MCQRIGTTVCKYFASLFVCLFVYSRLSIQLPKRFCLFTYLLTCLCLMTGTQHSVLVLSVVHSREQLLVARGVNRTTLVVLPVSQQVSLLTNHYAENKHYGSRGTVCHINPRLAEEIVVSSWFKPLWAGKP